MQAAASKGRVLCIDDEPHVLRALRWLLQKEFEVHTSESAAEALRLLRQHDFDVVLSDQRMPGITGVEFLRHVRRLAPRAMRILLTGYSDLDAMVRSVNESEVYRFVTKPWDVRALPRLIAEAAQIARTEPAPLDVEHPPSANDPLADAVPAQHVTTVALHHAEALLIIDDDPEVHRQVAEAAGTSVEVLHARDLPSAVTLLDSRPIAVIVSEVSVGGRDATRLVRLLKASRPEIVSLVVSGQKDAQTVMSLINQGQVYRIVPKPLKQGFVKLLLASALNRHRQLLETPSVRRRFAVEAAGPGVAESLYQDMLAAGSAPAGPPHLRAIPGGRDRAPAAAVPGMIDQLKAGFVRLFRTA